MTEDETAESDTEDVMEDEFLLVSDSAIYWACHFSLVDNGSWLCGKWF